MNQLYRRGAELLLSGQVNWLATPLRPWLVDSTYTFSPNHVLFSEAVPVPARAARGPLLLSGLTVTDGAASAMTYTFGEVPGRPLPATAIILVLDNTDTLFWFANAGFGLPMTLNGAEIILSPDEDIGGFYRA